MFFYILSFIKVQTNSFALSIFWKQKFRRNKQFMPRIYSWEFIIWHFHRNKKEPVRSQQFLIKRDCDFKTGLKYSLFLLKKTDNICQKCGRTCPKITISCKKRLWFSTGLPSFIFLSSANIILLWKLFYSPVCLSLESHLPTSQLFIYLSFFH